jgi:hypothetical protein
MPEAQLHPNIAPRNAPSAVATAPMASAPGTAMPLTANSSSMWNCSPTPNINRITPTSASCCAMVASTTSPGVLGPTRVPASR